MNLMIKRIIITLISALLLTGCTQKSYMSSTKVSKGTSVLIVMPEQKCVEKVNGRNLIDEKILHPAHKECYYK
jgi:PBP1b-binding outer membrane lipoprotein LpoB